MRFDALDWVHDYANGIVHDILPFFKIVIYRLTAHIWVLCEYLQALLERLMKICHLPTEFHFRGRRELLEEYLNLQ